MDILYSPWRLQYILSQKPEGCIFCIGDDPAKDRDHLVLHRSRHSFVIMNMYPYNNGHLMVVPRRHVGDLQSLPEIEYTDMMLLLRLTDRIVNEVYRPQGLNIGLNLGRAAGAGIDEHVHVHILPRWNGDCNFMTAVGGVRVIPEDFGSAYNLLKEQFDRVTG